MVEKQRERLLGPILGCSLGTYLEFLDFALYASLAPIFALKFFPKESHDISIVYSWAIFAISFIARPISGFILGPLGDKIGIKKVMIFSLALMGISTAAIGLIPTYEHIGVYAPLTLIFLRILQGFAVSIEYNSLGIYLLNRKDVKNSFGYYSSFTSVGVIAGLISGGLIVALCLPRSAIENDSDWQWRVPFIICGIFVSFIGIYLRKGMYDDNRLKKNDSNGVIGGLFKFQVKHLLMGVFVTGFISIAAYVALGYMSNYLQIQRHYPINESIKMCCACGLAMLVAVPIGGWVSDKIGRINFMVFSSSIMILVSIFSIALIAYASTPLIILGLLILSAHTGFAAGGLPAFITEIFYQNHRYTGSTIAYNSGVAWIGGTAPMVLSYLFLKTNNPLIPGLYLSFFSLIALFAAISLRSQPNINGYTQTIQEPSFL
ncbi:MAG: MFS transporter [Gammaproteobacteria bacterium]|nr:MFS transporter [Gammaproteobacteria bacterium]